MSQIEIPMIVLTGGPCAGKTSAMAILEQRLSEIGYKVYIVPETATLLIQAGITPWEHDGSFQQFVLDEILHLEKFILRAARLHDREKMVILCDRGQMDGQAYVGPQAFDVELKKAKLTRVAARDGYDAVIFLRSAANGAEEFYTTLNNTARKETAEQARALDELTLNAWIGHHHLRVIDNSTDFKNKMHRTFVEVCRVLGEPEPLEIENKYLVRTMPDLKDLPPSCQWIQIEQAYLEDGSRIRRRGSNNQWMYYHTNKVRTQDPKVRIEVERRISEHEFYELLINNRDENYIVIKKYRICFVWKNQYFELDVFRDLHRPELVSEGAQKLILLEVELTTTQTTVDLPPFLDIVREVTLEEQYSNKSIARKTR